MGWAWLADDATIGRTAEALGKNGIEARKKTLDLIPEGSVPAITEGAFMRLMEHSLPLENEMARKAYGTSSATSEMLVAQKEMLPDRIKLAFAKERLGF